MRDLNSKARRKSRPTRPVIIEPSRPLWMPEDGVRGLSALVAVLGIAAALLALLWLFWGL